MIKYLILFCFFSNTILSQVSVSRQDILNQNISRISSYNITTTRDSLGFGLSVFDTISAAKVVKYYNARGLLEQQEYFNTMFVKNGVIKYSYSDTLLVEEVDNALQSALRDKLRRTIVHYDSMDNKQFTLKSGGNLEIVTYHQPRWTDNVKNKKYKTSFYAEASDNDSSCEISFNGKRYVLQGFDLYSYFDGITISRFDRFHPDSNEPYIQSSTFINTSSDIVVQQSDSIRETITVRTGFPRTLDEHKVVECDNVAMSYNVPDVIKTVRERFKQGRVIETVTNDLSSSFVIVEQFTYDMVGLLIEKTRLVTYKPTNSTSYSKVFYIYHRR